MYRIHLRFDRTFERMRASYQTVLGIALNNRKLFGSIFLLFCLLSCGLYAIMGRDFFPAVDAGRIRLHMRAPTATRIEETARIADQVEQEIRRIIPPSELETVLDNIGLPISGINISYSNGGSIGTMDAEILVSLRTKHHPKKVYIEALRSELPKRFPGIEFFFQPADIVTQILNFGLPAAIDLQFSGKDVYKSQALASELMKKIRQIPGAVDVHIQQRMDQPVVKVVMDRTRAQQLGFNAINAAQNVLVSLSGSFQTSPSFWLNPKNGVVYNLAVQSPQYRMDSIDKLLQTPVSSSTSGPPQLLGNFVKVEPAKEQAVISHYNIAPVIDVYISVEGRDLGSVADEVQKLVAEIKPKLPRGADIAMRGQVQTMQSSFIGLGVGLAIAIVLVYLLIVVNFQSWVDPFIIVTALPAALAGIAWMLFLTGTTLSVPALTGAIMTMGVATANSILLISFARQRLNDGLSAVEAALDAGSTRIRPVLMTAMAMIIGMIPMALGLGEGAEQNAPLGRATIGGLLFATISTLLFVPVVFASVHQWLATRTPVENQGTPRHE
jgi:multidrug efflux pump subunit AcrB